MEQLNERHDGEAILGCWIVVLLALVAVAIAIYSAVRKML